MPKIKTWSFTKEDIKKAIHIIELRKRFIWFVIIIALPAIISVSTMIFFKFVLGHIPQILLIAGFTINIAVLIVFAAVIHFWLKS